MKKQLYCLALAALMLAMPVACTPKNGGEPASAPQSTPAAAAKKSPTPVPKEAAPPEKKAAEQPESQVPSDQANMRIRFITQEYKDDNIAEIPYIEYDGETNPEIDSINRSMNQGLQQRYDDFMESREDNEWIEIRSYPFTSPDYLQVVTTSCMFPNYRIDGNMSSVNYDRKADKWISVRDIMGGLGLDEDTLLHKIGKLFEPEIPGQMIEVAVVKGFLIREGPEGFVTELLLEMTVDSDDSDPWRFFYSYTPEMNQLFRMNNMCLFDPAELDQMDPPLSYQMIPERP